MDVYSNFILIVINWKQPYVHPQENGYAVVEPYHRIIHSNKKEQTIDTS